MYSLQQQTFNAAVRISKRNVARRNKIVLGPGDIANSLNKLTIVENIPKKWKKIYIKIFG
jgi:hypothetical protein